MNINIKATGIELTEAIHNYVLNKVSSLERFLSCDEESVVMTVEIGKTTNHHKTGDFFRTEINLSFPGQSLRAEAVEDNLYATIDIAKDNLVEEIKTVTKRKNTLVKRGGRLLKNILRGFR
jgi:putative sigma-54 modulation protein